MYDNPLSMLFAIFHRENKTFLSISRFVQVQLLIDDIVLIYQTLPQEPQHLGKTLGTGWWICHELQVRSQSSEQQSAG